MTCKSLAKTSSTRSGRQRQGTKPSRYGSAECTVFLSSAAAPGIHVHGCTTGRICCEQQDRTDIQHLPASLVPRAQVLDQVSVNPDYKPDPPGVIRSEYSKARGELVQPTRGRRKSASTKRKPPQTAASPAGTTMTTQQSGGESQMPCHYSGLTGLMEEAGQEAQQRAALQVAKHFGYAGRSLLSDAGGTSSATAARARAGAMPPPPPQAAAAAAVNVRVSGTPLECPCGMAKTCNPRISGSIPAERTYILVAVTTNPPAASTGNA